MRPLRHILQHWVGLDRPILYIVCGRAWGFVSGPVTMYLVTQFFSPEMQGYYYTFGGVLALQLFLEMGFSQCIMQYASHEFARLRFGPGGRLEGDPEARSRLVSLGRLSAKWYAVLAVLLILGIGVGGQIFFALEGGSREWLGPWWFLCVMSGASLALLPFWSLLEGCNQLPFVYGYRSGVAVLQSAAIWLALALGAGLYCGGISTLTAVGAGVVLLLARWHGLAAELARGPQGAVLSWRREIWPYQWRLAISGMCGYFIFNLFTPVLFHFRGPVAAGQMGMALTLVNSLHAVASSWTFTKAPQYGILISLGRRDELDRLSARATRQAFFICLAGGLLLLAAVAWLKRYFEVGSRIADLGTVAFLVGATCVNQIIYGQAYYLRAHKKEPFMWLSVADAALTAIGVVAGSKYLGLLGAAGGYALAQLAILPAATWIYQRNKRLWRLGPAQPAAELATPNPTPYPDQIEGRQ